MAEDIEFPTPLTERQFAEVKHISKERLSELMARTYEIMRDGEPMFVRLLARRLNIPISIASTVLHFLREAHKNVWVEYVRMRHPEGSLAWQKYKVHYVVDHTPIENVVALKERLELIGNIGYECSVIAERALTGVCTNLFGTMGTDVSSYNGSGNDVVAHPISTIFEMSIRTSNPIDMKYINHKLAELMRAGLDGYRLVVIAPRFRNKVLANCMAGNGGKVVVHVLPDVGFMPLFRGFWGHAELFESVGRAVVRMTVKEYKEHLDSIISRYIQ